MTLNPLCSDTQLIYKRDKVVEISSVKQRESEDGIEYNIIVTEKKSFEIKMT